MIVTSVRNKRNVHGLWEQCDPKSQALWPNFNSPPVDIMHPRQKDSGEVTKTKLGGNSQDGDVSQDTPQCVGTYNSHGISMQSSLSTKFGFLMYRSSMCIGHTYVAHLKQCLESSDQSRVQISLWHTKTKGKIRKKAPLCHLLAQNP